MTTLKLPRPTRGPIPFRGALMLQQLGILDRTADAICDYSLPLLAASLKITEEEANEELVSLVCRKRILLGSNKFAILSRLSAKLKQERDRNRLRAKRNQAVDWSLHRRTRATFACLRPPVERPRSYNRPAAFEPLLARYPSHHKTECPADVEVRTEACYPGELQSVITFIAEQESAHRPVVLLYTRKAVYVGVRVSPKR